ncbi:hypothetical protein QMN02_15220 [Leptospira santarosai]|nr:hypothetical protein [Leptospira santarosai]MDI7166404.1 hypothetical protein [Leptospira santarosai]
MTEIMKLDERTQELKILSVDEAEHCCKENSLFDSALSFFKIIESIT